MAAIGFVNGTIEKGFVGQLKTLSIRASIEISPNRSMAGNVQPDLRVSPKASRSALASRSAQCAGPREHCLPQRRGPQGCRNTRGIPRCRFLRPSKSLPKSARRTNGVVAPLHRRSG